MPSPVEHDRSAELRYSSAPEKSAAINAFSYVMVADLFLGHSQCCGLLDFPETVPETVVVQILVWFDAHGAVCPIGPRHNGLRLLVRRHDEEVLARRRQAERGATT